MITTAMNDGALWITLNRPQQRNALNQSMYRELKAALEQGDADPECKALVLRAEGPDFCAGNDLADFQKPSPEVFEAIMGFLRVLPHLKTPLVALVQGRAIGIGTTMLMYADFVFSSQDACFSTPFASLGLCPEAGSSLLFSQVLGKTIAVRLLLLGEQLFAPEAKAAGWLMDVCPNPENLSECAHKVIERLKGLPPSALHATKRLMAASQYASVKHVMEQEKETFVSLLQQKIKK